MNTFIENLNQWGSDFLRFAGPMLWQSGLLIGVLFGIDHLCRRHLRASVRYALWLVVLVKLALPPSLALPTSPVWWLHKIPSAVATTPARHYMVAYDQGPPAEIAPPGAPLPAPLPALTAGAWMLVLSGGISGALLFWLLVRWAEVTRRVRRATCSERLTRLADETQSLAGTSFPVQVKLTDNLMSPAVCGLFRPAILIPQSLVENFSDEQLRAVLLHELIHLRRRDVWINFLQALLQIVYWWHPLVWLANARLRRAREEAVDDAVVLALRDEAEDYAPTLLAVAKLSLSRPLVSLGLIGIMESRHSLRQRIERLLDARSPRRAGLTLASCLGILAFTAVAVPMGDAPVKSGDVPAANDSHRQAILITAEFYALPDADTQKVRLPLDGPYVDDLKMVSSITPSHLAAFQAQCKAAGLRPFCRPRVETAFGVEAALTMGDSTNGVKFSCCPLAGDGGIKLGFRAEIHGNAVDDDLNLAGTVLSGTNLIADGGHLVAFPFGTGVASDKKHLVLIIGIQTITSSPPVEGSQQMSDDHGDKLAATDEMREAGTLVQDAKLDYEMGKLDEAEQRLNSALALNPTDASARFYLGLVQAARINPRDSSMPPPPRLEAVITPNILNQQAGKANSGFSSSAGTAEALVQRTFRVLPNLPKEDAGRPLGRAELDSVINDDLKALGIVRQPPTAFFYDDLGLLFVKATQRDLDTVDRNLRKSFHAPPQLHIKARFLEMPKGTWKSLEKFPGPTNGDPQVLAILTSKQQKSVLQKLGATAGVLNLAEPEVTTTSGRETQMRSTQMATWLKGSAVQSDSSLPQPVDVETGPVCDTSAWVLSDGCTIYMRASAQITELFGADAHHSGKLPIPLAGADIRLWDNQTVVMAVRKHIYEGGREVAVEPAQPSNPADAKHVADEKNREVLALVTATMVDPAGNRVHSDADLPFAKDAVPPQ